MNPNYPSCIKIPSTNSKQDATITVGGNIARASMMEIQETEILYNELVLIADRIFGERKWSHIVTNQEIDSVESFMGKYVCGCVTFLKIQLSDGVFHEDMGYYYTEAAIKSVSIQSARIGSHVDAFKRVLSCFGKEIGHEIQKLSKTPKLDKITDYKTDLEYFETLEPCAQSTPLLEVNATRQNSSNIPKSLNNVQLTVTKPEIQKTVQKPLEHKVDNVMRPIQSNTIYEKKQTNGKTEQNAKKELTEEEALRNERKRKQMEKQAEYKRLMKEREQQRLNKL
ncbi:DNA repair protein RAD52 homolog [Ceratina calcarata]|uniref:DNA repair protein RAD52 homolog n=1 Tax=Ceratina calcarata TaxID=156304 RepID=A0AAJ7J3F3_9HYME|nr:DNA repair protein RAD52 homolog [Ceratina calcarata]